MQGKKYNLFWNFIFVLIIVSVCFGVYYASKRVDYIWRWERLLQYFVYEDVTNIRTPVAGNVKVTDGKIKVIPMQAGEPYTVKKFETKQVSDGDLVFEGDILASNSRTRAGPLLTGLYMTIKLSIVAIFFAIIIGVLTGIARISSNPALKKLAVTYIELIRGTPLLVQIFIFYFFIGTVLHLNRFTSGTAALAVFTGAYIAEIVRAGIQSIPKGQMEASRSLGMNYFQAMRHIIMPQALKRTLPPMAGQFISLIKDSSLVSVISITDLTKSGREIVTSTFSPFEVWFSVALLYLVLTSSLSFFVQILERRLSESD
ncbi:amino acid ABC transporter permease [Flexistipes sp.]|uniref:amino acid ABC transporter permease n=1 Tax=Flexistipes sp. TaxID=3088135 RepID=UPI002E1BC43A|nr:amino acid ABC transporter permease [Flexistipes sp.]